MNVNVERNALNGPPNSTPFFGTPVWYLLVERREPIKTSVVINNKSAGSPHVERTPPPQFNATFWDPRLKRFSLGVCKFPSKLYPQFTPPYVHARNPISVVLVLQNSSVGVVWDRGEDGQKEAGQEGGTGCSHT